MARDADQIVVAQSGDVWIAPVGTAHDEDPATPPIAPWVNLGYTTEDGVSFGIGATVENIGAWQSSTPVRRMVTAREVTLGFSLEQWNEDNFALAFGGGAWSEVEAPVPPAPGQYRYDPPEDNDALAEYALAVDFQDGAKASRVCVYRGTAGDLETTLNRTGAAVLPITFAAMVPDGGTRSWHYLTNDPAFETVGA